MRGGPGDQMSVGERVAFYRARRGYTQAQLAGLVGRSTDWLSKVERGERGLRRVDVLIELARALRVGLPDLLGQPVLMEDERDGDDVPVVRDALMAPARLSRSLYPPSPAAPVDVQRAARLAHFLWDDYQGGRVGSVVAALPRAIRTAQRSEDDGTSRGWAVSARVHHLAATTLAKLGEADLSWIAAERAVRAAEEADDVLVLASAARAATHALLAVGRYADALDLGATAASWLERQVATGDPAALSLAGMLHLRTAVAAARHQDRSLADDLLSRAERVAERLGSDANHWHTGFGPTNVELHRSSVALELGDIASVAERGPRIAVDHLPVERRVTHRIDLGRAFAELARDAEALDLLLRAEQEGPTLVRHSPAVRETVRSLHRRSPVTGGRSSELFALALRCRAAR